MSEDKQPPLLRKLKDDFWEGFNEQDASIKADTRDLASVLSSK